MTYPLRRRPGFTLVELLVVIAIIGILVALLLPAVQAARAAARRMQCSNNVKQLVLATHNYHDIHKTFPLNYANWRSSHPIDGSATSWMTQTLPFIEQQPLYDQINFAFGCRNDPRNAIANPNGALPSNEKVARTSVAAFQCPEDSHDGTLDLNRANYRCPSRSWWGNRNWGVNNYKGNAGANWTWGVYINRANRGHGATSEDPFGHRGGHGLDRGNGPYFRGNNWPCSTKIAAVLDGTSTTFAVGEAVPEWCTHTWWYHPNGVTATTAVPLNQRAIRANCQSGNKLADLICARSDWPNNYSFMSKHTGGAFFGMCDGSTHFIGDNIDILAYRRLGSMMDGQPAVIP